MSFKNIVGHKREIEIIKKMLKNKRISHAYLLAGKEGTGKKKIAFEIIKYLNCLNRDNENLDSCDECVNCKKMDNGNQQDYFYVQPVDEKIKIDQIRGLINSIFYKSVNNEYKCVLIDDCEKITVEAANSLLKLIEEPPEKTCFFLISADEEKVLKTIRSRCQKINFSGLAKGNIEALLKKDNHQSENLDFIIDFSEGSFGNTLKYMNDMGFMEDIRDFDDILRGMEDRTYTNLMSLSKTFEKDRKKLFLFIEYMMYNLEKSLKGKSEIFAVSNYFAINDIIEEIITAKQMLDRNINPRFISENLLIKIKLILKG